MIRLEKNGLRKKVSTGYSWKGLFFGCLYPIARGDLYLNRKFGYERC